MGIGEFAGVTHLSIRTLRRYHDAGLLEPARVDPATGYRSYSPEQVPTAQVIHQLRALDLPIIFVSGHADVPIVVRAFKAGAHDFIEKPYNEQLLLDSVQQALSNCAAQRSGSPGHDALQARLLTLTPRERDVLLPLVQGYTTREIAEQLGVSAKTVDLYRSRVMKRMQATTLPDLVGMAIAAELIDPLKLR